MERLLTVGVRAARAGGAIQMRSLGRLGKGQTRRKGASDWVTVVDHASEKKIISIIRSAFPDHDILGEESGETLSGSDYRWIIDPLDGTVNFMHQFPMFCVSIGVTRRGVLVAGVIYDPLREELFTALKGRGARLNGRPIRVSRHGAFQEALLATGFPFRAKRLPGGYMQSFRAFFLRTGSIRRAGSAALDLAYTACGRLDGFWEMALKPWDMAAGALLIQEAGGRVTDFFGGPDFLENGLITAANRPLQKRMVGVLKPIFKGRV
ncbi:MAG: inositol monophosphatase [Candidatus Omnitrophica bacterium CG11_big_fil_rev_8_21_14_0_20_64_10]|nr:MAG: inositol monophosphatase [Candidatus Omnitrophica bacterium CG11_big_fil_rev_8_21_14_0_20_64_10]